MRTSSLISVPRVLFPQSLLKLWAQYDLWPGFGVIMCEVLELKEPWDEPRFKKYSTVLIDAVIAGERPKFSVKNALQAPPGYVTLMQKSWAHASEDRPDFITVLYQLQDMHRVALAKMVSTTSALGVETGQLVRRQQSMPTLGVCCQSDPHQAFHRSRQQSHSSPHINAPNPSGNSTKDRASAILELCEI